MQRRASQSCLPVAGYECSAGFCWPKKSSYDISTRALEGAATAGSLVICSSTLSSARAFRLNASATSMTFGSNHSVAPRVFQRAGSWKAYRLKGSKRSRDL